MGIEMMGLAAASASSTEPICSNEPSNAHDEGQDANAGDGAEHRCWNRELGLSCIFTHKDRGPSSHP